MFTSFQNAKAIAPHYALEGNGLPSETTQQQRQVSPQPLIGSEEVSLQQLAVRCLSFLHDSQLMVATIAHDMAAVPAFDAVAHETSISAADAIAVRAELAAEAVSRAEHAMHRILLALRQHHPQAFDKSLAEASLPSPVNSTGQETSPTPGSCAIPAVCLTPLPHCISPVPKNTTSPSCPAVVSSRTATAQLSPVVAVAPTLSPTPVQSQPTQPTATVSQTVLVSTVELCIRCTTDIESVWYADRQLPDFVLELHNIETGALQTQINGWRVRLSVEDGLGRDVTSTACRLAPESLILEFDAGRITVQGFRFAEVSSKYASGVFRIVAAVELGDSASLVAPFVSHNIQVLSYRLFHAPKVPAHRLRPEDNLSKMKGIGSMYAKRLREVGVCCIRDLAALAHDKAACCAIVERIRKERGALTMAKLAEHIAEAQNVLARWETDSPSPSPTASHTSSPTTSISPVFAVLPATAHVVPVDLRRRKRALETVGAVAAPESKRVCKVEDVRNFSSLCSGRDSFDVVESFLGSDWI